MENIIEPKSKLSTTNLIKNILLAGFVAGTLDILAAIVVYALVMGVTTATRILQSIAAGVFGKQSFEGGTPTAIYGLIFHYIIAFSWTTAFVLLFPYIPFLRKHKIISGLIYGVIVWIGMNLIVVPLSSIGWRMPSWDSVLIGVIILMICIGLPVSLITNYFYRTKI